MEIKEWVAIGIAVVTLINGWSQFWIKERLFNKEVVTNDPFLKLVKSKIGIALFATSGITALVSIVLLVIQAISNDPLTRLACVMISGLSVATILNIFLVQTVYTLRRLARMKQEIENAKDEAAMIAIVFS